MQNVRSKAPPKVSIVIPSFNKVKFIGQTLDSIFSQKYKNIEVIIQDGGSNDGTAEIIKKYSKRYPKKIIFESKKDKGQLDAINKGLNKATGEIVTFINADDVYEGEVFASVIKSYIRNQGSAWFAGRGIVINSDGREIAKPFTSYKNLLFRLNNYALLLMTNYLIQPSVFLTRASYKKFGPFTGTEDFVMEYEMWLKMGASKMPVIINKVFTKFRIEEGTKTKRMFIKILNEDQRIVERYTKNLVILALHKLNNLGRVIVGRFF